MEEEQKRLRIVPLGGLGEVGKNMMALEWDKKILIIDAGLSFPEEKNPGIDYIIPNISYLKKRKKDILGIVFTHGHYDHIGAIPYIMDDLGNPPLFGSPLTLGILEKRQEEYPNQPKLKLNKVKDGSQINLGPFNIEFFHQNHNIPDNLGLFIETPVGNIVNTSDFKFDSTPTNAPPTDFDKIKSLGKKGVLLMLSDSTGAENEGRSLSEKTICENMEKIFKEAKGRLITATFASLINRIQDIIYLSEKYGRKVVVEGYGMQTNVEIARNLKLLKIKKGTIVTPKKALDLPDNKVTLICTGAQGEERAALVRIANGEHRSFHLKSNDTVVLSSSTVPGNERAVQNLRDDILRQGATVFHSKMMDIHAKGHANEEELKEMIKMLKPKFLIPIHGQYSMLIRHKEIAESTKVPKGVFVIENGEPALLSKDGIQLEKKKISSKPVLIDGSGIGDVGGVVLYDRQELAESGIFVVIVVRDKKEKTLKNSPDIISRGFIYLRNSQDMLAASRKKIREIMKESSQNNYDVKKTKYLLKKKLESFLYSRTKRRPIVVPVVIEV